MKDERRSFVCSLALMSGALKHGLGTVSRIWDRMVWNGTVIFFDKW